MRPMGRLGASPLITCAMFAGSECPEFAGFTFVKGVDSSNNALNMIKRYLDAPSLIILMKACADSPECM